ncbi:TetR/AcrR family transcriptional regulator [Ktedonosporobacter rubrisoli]|uniref:TetR/AcrR family transcriptional regulator n=1 Tax=Ktedonosporobacter rubrisoli TaxID=2509675 RepID=A0A4P6JMH7_KTERU|nr:TetR/AcrR family transcriptional regulator [Ktedonosporobacter rubrisoli]QBD76459.1 TetR/AcrR family transcriptional regulator [Ktedonosporobacter rubrisoli]
MKKHLPVPAPKEEQREAEPKKRPGGRSARVRQAVLAATLELLRERGYEGMTTRDIAAQAGVNEASLFRRWGTKAAIVAEALQNYSAFSTPTPDTGSLQSDLLELLCGIIARIQTPLGQAISQIVVGHNSQPELEDVRHAYWRDRLSRANAIVQRAKERGELSEEVDAAFLVEAAIGPLLARSQVTDRPLDEHLPEQIVALLLYGLTGSTRHTDF